VFRVEGPDHGQAALERLDEVPVMTVILVVSQ
jgi:hypothetical protein